MEITADCVIALSFGKASDKSTIDPNKEIATIASSFQLPVIAQKEVAVYCKKPLEVKNAGRGYLDTFQVLREAKLLMEKAQCKNAVLVAHSSHIKRVEKQAAFLNIKYTSATKLPQMWDRNSKQWWTRSPWLWRIHEAVTIPYLVLANKM